MTGIQELKRLASTFNVLYVEDEASVREQMRRFLGKLFARVGVAANGREGLRQFGAERYDLVITDLRMPVLDGLEMIQRIRAKNGEIPIIVATAFNDSDYLLRAIEFGVSHYLLKPLDSDKLIDTLYKTVSQLGLERKVQQLTARIRELLNFQTNLMVVVRGDQVTTANRRFLALFGVENLQQFRDKGYTIADFLVDEEGFCYPREGEEWLKACMATPGVPQKAKLRDPLSGKPRAYLLNGAPLPGPEGEFVLSLTDISDVEAQYHALQQEASTDPLTKLPNWLKFHSDFSRAVTHAYEQRVPLGMIALKPDDFSLINDRYGYHVGDTLIIELAELIQSNLAPSQLLARLSGVQFGILCRGVDLQRTRTLAERLRGTLENWPFSHGIHVTCGFGVAALRAGDAPDDLFNRADRHLIRARKQGPGGLEADLEEEQPELEQEREEIRALLLEGAEKGVSLLFHNTYKGLGISSTGKLLPDLPGSELTFKVHANQAKAMGRERSTILSCELFPMRVTARVARVSMHHLTVSLDELRYTATTAMDRAVLRIQPDTPIAVEIHGPHGFSRGEIVDTSLKALAVRLPAAHRLRLGADLRLRFRLPAGESRTNELALDGRVLKLDEITAEAVITLFTNKFIDEQLRHYISQRQLELVHELQAYTV